MSIKLVLLQILRVDLDAQYEEARNELDRMIQEAEASAAAGQDTPAAPSQREHNPQAPADGTTPKGRKRASKSRPVEGSGANSRRVGFSSSRRAGLPAHIHRARGSKPGRPRNPLTANPDSTETPKPPTRFSDLVREACQHLPEGFTRVEVLDWLEKRYPERMAQASNTTVDSTMFNLRSKCEIVETGERQGLTCPLKTHKWVGNKA